TMKPKQYVKVCFFLQLFNVGISECGNVLIWPTEGSHWINLKPVIGTLSDRGHNITVLVHRGSLFMGYNKSSSFHYELFDVPFSNETVHYMLEDFLNFWMYEMEHMSYWAIYSKIRHILKKDKELFLQICDGVLRSTRVMEKLRKIDFDLMFADPIYPCSELVAEKLGIPFVYTLRFSIANSMERLCGQIPAPPSYVPAAMGKFTDQMDFTDRLKNFLFYWSQDILALSMWSELDSYYSEILGRPTTFCETMGKADIWLIRTYWDFEYPRPFLPNFQFVGGLHCKPAKPLPENMEEFVQSSGEDGIVVFSLGSMVKNLTREKANIIASALGQIPQKVLWRYSGEKPDTLSPNTRVYDWIPQNDLLGHPKTKVFITHGGTNGIYEAIYHGVPMVGIPLFGDQPDNMMHMKTKGAAVVVDFNSMESRDLVDALSTVLHDTSYRENAMRLSRIHHDQPMTPLERAVFWIEFVMRHKGAKHLRVQAHNLAWYQYHSLDVIAVLLASTAAVVFILIKSCGFCFRRCCRRPKAKPKKE
ncbi:UD2A1 glucuronosyltransferase, partial [Atractosteus spatula]|nr:UD2A1 glucuronosyltransferase [Atractosteus spatula]